MMPHHFVKYEIIGKSSLLPFFFGGEFVIVIYYCFLTFYIRGRITKNAFGGDFFEKSLDALACGAVPEAGF